MKRIIRYIRSLHPLAAIVLRGCLLVSIAQTLVCTALIDRYAKTCEQ